MTESEPIRSSWSERWEAYWFAPVPPHTFALLRIIFGALALLGLAGLTPVDMFWALDGLSPLPSNPSGPRAWLFDHGLQALAGYLYFGCSAVAAAAMLVGFRSDAAVLAVFLGLWLQTYWNRLPLSSAHQVVLVVLFCLLWTESGRVWSVDAKTRRGRGHLEPGSVPVWPLRLIRCQIALVYLSSALWKLLYPVWRDGTAVYYAINLNVFHRFPWPIPPGVEPFLPFFTWGTLLFELTFPVLVWFRATRTAALVAGIGLHLGLLLTLEIGPFSLVMMASYVAFLDPHRVARQAKDLLAECKNCTRLRPSPRHQTPLR